MKKTLLLFGFITLLSLMNQAQTTVTDIDGNVYNTLSIGTQIWLKENLNVTRYQNGDYIPNVTIDTVWSNLTYGARSYYNNDSSLNSPVYGAIYNWFALNDTRKICPIGCHVPTETDWNNMELYLDNTVDTNSISWTGTTIGGDLKDTILWNAPNTGANNTTGFSASAGGYKGFNGQYFSLGDYGFWWSASANDSLFAWDRYLSYNNSKIGRYNDDKKNGFYIRCICDSITTLIEDNGVDKAIIVYPNPFTDKINIKINEIQKFNIQIFSVIGDRVYQEILTNNTNLIDISFLPSGIFIVRLTGSDISYQYKLIKN